MGFLKPTGKNITLTILIYIAALVFFFPANFPVVCDAAVGSPCPLHHTTFINIWKINNQISEGFTINYPYLITQLIISYILAYFLVKSLQNK